MAPIPFSAGDLPLMPSPPARNPVSYFTEGFLDNIGADFPIDELNEAIMSGITDDIDFEELTYEQGLQEIDSFYPPTPDPRSIPDMPSLDLPDPAETGVKEAALGQDVDMGGDDEFGGLMADINTFVPDENNDLPTAFADAFPIESQTPRRVSSVFHQSPLAKSPNTPDEGQYATPEGAGISRASLAPPSSGDRSQLLDEMRDEERQSVTPPETPFGASLKQRLRDVQAIDCSSTHIASSPMPQAAAGGATPAAEPHADDVPVTHTTPHSGGVSQAPHISSSEHIISEGYKTSIQDARDYHDSQHTQGVKRPRPSSSPPKPPQNLVLPTHPLPKKLKLSAADSEVVAAQDDNTSKPGRKLRTREVAAPSQKQPEGPQPTPAAADITKFKAEGDSPMASDAVALAPEEEGPKLAAATGDNIDSSLTDIDSTEHSMDASKSAAAEDMNKEEPSIADIEPTESNITTPRTDSVMQGINTDAEADAEEAGAEDQAIDNTMEEPQTEDTQPKPAAKSKGKQKIVTEPKSKKATTEPKSKKPAGITKPKRTTSSTPKPKQPKQPPNPGNPRRGGKDLNSIVGNSVLNKVIARPAPSPRKTRGQKKADEQAQPSAAETAKKRHSGVGIAKASRTAGKGMDALELNE